MEKCVNENIENVQASRGGAQPAVEWNIEVALVKQQGDDAGVERAPTAQKDLEKDNQVPACRSHSFPSNALHLLLYLRLLPYVDASTRTRALR